MPEEESILVGISTDDLVEELMEEGPSSPHYESQASKAKTV